MNTITTENKIKPNYKKTSVGIIPEDWEMQKMKEMGKFYRGKGIPKKDLVDEGLNAIRYGEIYTIHHYFIKEFYSFIAKETANTSFLLNKGDILFTGSGETLEDIGKSVAFISDEKAYAGGDITILRPKKNEYYSKFLGFLTNNDVFRKQTYRAGQGQSVVHIYPSNLKEIQLPIPPLAEQTAIADCLSTWDSGIEKLSALITAKKEQKKGLMQGIFSGKLKVENGELVKAKEGENFLKDWEKVRINEISKLGRGRVISKKEIESNLGIYPVYSSQTTNNGVLGYLNTYDFEGEYITWTTDGVNAGSIFYRTGRFNCTNVCGTVKLKKGYDYYFVKSALDKVAERYVSKTLANPKLMNGVFGTIEILIPSFKEQTAIAEVLTTADKEIELLEKKLEYFKIQKKGLMQVLLTGERRLVES